MVKLVGVLGLIVAMLAAACGPFRSPDRGPDPLEVVIAAGRAPAAADTVWPGYALGSRDFIVYEPGRSAIIHTAAGQLEHFEEPQASALPASLQGRVFEYRGRLPGLEGGIDTRYGLGELTMTAVASGADLGSSLATLYHEAFHTFQHERFTDPGISTSFVPAEAITREFAAMAEVERRMLVSALELEAGAPLDSLLRQYLAVRFTRLDASLTRVAEVERRLERHEGSANLVGYASAAAALGLGDDRVLAAVRQFLTAPLHGFGGGASTRLIRWRVYGTGAAIGLLLNRRGTEWKERLTEGSGFDELLADAIGFDPSWAPTLAGAALDDFGFAKLVARRQGPWGPLGPGLTEARFNERAPVRLVLDLVPGDTTARFQFSFNIRNNPWRVLTGRRGGIEELDAGLIVISNPAMLSMPDKMGARLILRDRPVMFDQRGWPEHGRIVVLLPRLPRIDGADPSPGERLLPAGSIVEAHRTRLELTSDASILVAADSMVVRLRPAAGPPGPEP